MLEGRTRTLSGPSPDLSPPRTLAPSVRNDPDPGLAQLGATRQREVESSPAWKGRWCGRQACKRRCFCWPYLASTADERPLVAVSIRGLHPMRGLDPGVQCLVTLGCEKHPLHKPVADKMHALNYHMLTCGRSAVRSDQPAYIQFRRNLGLIAQSTRYGLNYDEVFDEQLKLALDGEEIASQLQMIDIARDYLVQCVQNVAPELWQQVASERQRVQEAETNHDTVQQQLYAVKYGGLYERLTRRLQLGDLERREKAAQATLDIALDNLKKVFGTSYSTELHISYSPGLSEVFDPRYEITTRAARDLSSILSVIRGGSIGLAGPRGSGKTTLIESGAALLG
jgi:hypothetical protein